MEAVDVLARIKYRVVETGITWGVAIILLTQSLRNDTLPLWIAIAGFLFGLGLMFHGIKLWSLRYGVSDEGLYVQIGLRSRLIKFHEIRKARYLTPRKNRGIILECNIRGREKRFQLPIHALSDEDRLKFRQALETRVERAFPKKHGLRHEAL